MGLYNLFRQRWTGTGKTS